MRSDRQEPGANVTRAPGGHPPRPGAAGAPKSSVTISASQRDLLYERILIHLSGVDGVWSAATNERLDEAQSLGREFSDELRLIVDDLGWGERSGDEPIELTTPPDVVQRVVERIAALAEDSDAAEEETRAALRAAEEEHQQVRETCDQILADLTKLA
jgi:hypothetical protein